MSPVEERVLEDIEKSKLEQELGEGGKILNRAGEASGGQQRVADQTHRKNDHEVSNQAPTENLPHRLLVRRHSSENFVLREEIILLDDQIGQVANEPDQLMSDEHSSHKDGCLRVIVGDRGPKSLYKSRHVNGTRVKQRLRWNSKASAPTKVRRCQARFQTTNNQTTIHSKPESIKKRNNLVK